MMIMMMKLILKGFDISESIKSQAKKKELQEMSETIEEQEKDD